MVVVTEAVAVIVTDNGRSCGNNGGGGEYGEGVGVEAAAGPSRTRQNQHQQNSAAPYNREVKTSRSSWRAERKLPATLCSKGKANTVHGEVCR